jgi:hypothetical protein
MSQQTPIAKFKAGQVSAALWENQIEAGGRPATILKATIQRRYKDTAGRWKSSTSFSRNEIPLQRAFEKIVELQNDTSTKGESDGLS